MEVKVETDNKEFEIYETEKFRFKIEKVSLDNMREKENFTTRLITKIQKSMKQTIKIVSGQEWEGSYRAIFKEIVGREVE